MRPLHHYLILCTALLLTACSAGGSDMTAAPQSESISLSTVTASSDNAHEITENNTDLPDDGIIYQDDEVTVRTAGAYPEGMSDETLWGTETADELFSSADAVVRIAVIHRERVVFEYTYLDTPCETYKTIYTANVTDVYKGDISGEITFAVPDSKYSDSSMPVIEKDGIVFLKNSQALQNDSLKLVSVCDCYVSSPADIIVISGDTADADGVFSQDVQHTADNAPELLEGEKIEEDTAAVIESIYTNMSRAIINTDVLTEQIRYFCERFSD